MDEMIAIDGLTRRFGARTAVDHVSFSVRRGEVLGFLGPNGAGKTTTMRMITGFLAPSEGRALVCGLDVTEHPIEVKKRIGYVPEGAPLYGDMNTVRFLRFIGEVRGLSGAALSAAVERVIDLVHLEGVVDQTVDTLSKGYKRRVALAQAIIHDPDILILDEPTEGLDPNQKHDVRALINRMAPEKAIIISTHILEEVHAVCTRAVIIAEGRLVADGTPHALEARAPEHNCVYLDVAAAARAAVSADLVAHPDIIAVELLEEGGEISRLLVRPRAAAEILTTVSLRLQAQGVAVHGIRVVRGDLDRVFRDITVPSRTPAGIES